MEQQQQEFQKEGEKKEIEEGEKEYRSCIIQQDGEKRGFDNSLQGDDFMTIDQCQTIREMEDSQLVGPPLAASASVSAAATSLVALGHVDMVDVEVRTAARVIDVSSVKRKRGRPPRIQGKTGPSLPPQRKKMDEEDVCFICFDGGSLVLCDRRGCPKAYHPACIKRDEAFFRSKAKWNCGWHICSSCQKASHYMCYTCTFSLCKGCTKGADYVCVRGTKGFCGTCMRTIMLIENITLGNTEKVQVDFDDQTSWEFLFKVYWTYLKAKLSLTIDELTSAKNPWKGDELPKTKNSWKGTRFVTSKEVCTDEPFYANNEKGSSLNNCFGNVEANHFKRRKTEDQSDQLDQSKLLIEKNTLVMEESTIDNGTPLPERTTWATKELLEFVGHMKNGDTSLLSQFDVQTLLLEYVKRKNLRDPHQKCQIVCDSRLINLFGRPRLGHIEMLKLLENHYLIKEKSQADDAVRATVPDALSSQSEGAGSSDSQLVLVNDRRCRTRKRTNEKESPINPNPDEYAAVDVHNINLLYVKRSLMENLLDDAKNFYEKVVGSFVRIRISSGDQKQEMHRLVQVVGTSKVDESYKVGSRTADVKLEVLNLDKEEVVSIDEISNQDFSVDECRRLRQSIKCGLIKRLKVVEIQEKAMVLQPVKVSDCLEAEILRFNHLRDRASEKGHRKEECVEKLELLKSPEERQRRLLEIHDIHIDPNMDPSYESEEDAGESDDKKQGGVARKGIEGDLNDVGTRALKTLAIASEKVRNMDNTFYVDPEHTIRIQEGVSESAWSQGGGALGLHSQNGSKIQLGGAGAVTVDWKSQAAVRSESLPGVASSFMAPPLSSGNELFVSEFETDKLWHYQDPSRKIQGPFSMMQLRKWSASEIFPHDFRVWRVNEKQDDSILLSDALLGRFHREPLQPRDSYSLPQIVTSNDADKKWEYGLRQSTDLTWIDNKRIDNDQEPVQNDVQVHANIDKSNGLGSHSSTWTKVSDVAISDDAQAQRSLEGWELPEGSKSWAGQSQNCSLLSAPSSSGKPCEAPFLHEREGHGDEKWSLNPGRANEVSNRTTKGQTNVKESDEKRADSEGHSSQSSGQNWRPHSMNSSTSGWDFNSGFVSVVESIGKTERTKEIDFSNMLSPTAKQSHEDLKVQVAENKLSLSSNVPVQDSGPSWSTASSLVIGGEWVGYSSTPAKPCVEEWDSNLVSASSLKPTEGTSDHAATPTSGTDQLTHSSSTHPTIDASSWQPMVPEPNEFCSLVDESVSDLLAEVEAMESLGGLPSPTSKMRCDGELTPGSDDDCFSPVEPFSPAPDPGKSDALSSTGDIKMPYQLAVAEESLRLSLMLSQPTIADEPLAVSQVPSQLTLINKPPQLAQMSPQGIVPDEPVRASQMPSQSTLTEEPFRLWQSNALDSQKSFSGHSSSAEAEGETKHSEVSVNQWETRLEIQPLRLSTVKQGEAGSDIHQAPTPSRVSQWEAGFNNRRPASSTVDACQGTDKGNANLNQGVAPQGNTNLFWGSGHGSIQQQGSTNSVISAGNQGSWGNQPRYGGDNRYSGQRDHRNHFQIRDSGFGRDRSSNRRPSYGGGNGGSYKPPSKGQRVCKFFENGYCKKGASCSYWHP